VAGTFIVNTSTENATLPAPVGGILGPGGTALVPYSTAQLAVYGITPVGTLRLTDLGSSYMGPYSTQHPTGAVAITDVVLYADPVNGNDANNGLTPISAVRSTAVLVAMMDQYPAYMTRFEIVFMYGAFANTAQTLYMLAPTPLPGAQAFVVRGYSTPLDDPHGLYGKLDSLQTVAGPFTVATVVNSDNAAITFTGVGLTSNQYQAKGFRTLFTTGAHAGYENAFRHHTAGSTVTAFWMDEQTCAPGDQFVIQQIMTIIPCGSIFRDAERGGYFGSGLQFNISSGSIVSSGQWSDAGPHFNSVAGFVSMYSLTGYVSVGSPPVIGTVAYSAAAYATTAGSRSTTYTGVSVFVFPGTLFECISSMSFDGAAGAAFLFNEIGGYMQLNAPYLFNAMGLVNEGLFESQGHHAVNTECNGTNVVAGFILGGYMGVGPASVMELLLFFNVSSPGAGLDVVHLRQGALANINGNGAASSAIVAAAAPGTGGYSLHCVDGGSAQFVSGVIAAQASGAQTNIDGTSYDLAVYANSAHTTGVGAGAITVSGVPSTTVPLRARITATGGIIGTATVQISLDNGASYQPAVTSAASIQVLNAGTAVLMAAGSYAANDEWTLNPNNTIANGQTSIKRIAASDV
jgi:hypothetical protein